MGARPTNVRWVVFSLAFGTSWVLYLHRYAFSLVKKPLQQKFDWTETELGLLDSAFFLCYTVFQIPAGIVADVLGARYFLAGMILLWSVALALHAAAPGLAAMWGARGVFGAAQAGAYAVLSRVTRFWFPLSVRTSVQGWIAVFAGRLGGASPNVLFATFLVGTLHTSWQTSLWLFAAVGVVLAGLFALLFRDSPREHPWVNEAEADLIEGPRAPGGAAKLPVSDLFRRTSRRSLLN